MAGVPDISRRAVLGGAASLAVGVGSAKPLLVASFAARQGVFA